MAIVHITAEDRRLAALPLLTPEYGGEVGVSYQENVDCEGIACGERMEAAFSAEELARWHEWNADRGPMPPHSHMIVRGLNPETQPCILAVLKTGVEMP